DRAQKKARPRVSGQKRPTRTNLGDAKMTLEEIKKQTEGMDPVAQNAFLMGMIAGQQSAPSMDAGETMEEDPSVDDDEPTVDDDDPAADGKKKKGADQPSAMGDKRKKKVSQPQLLDEKIKELSKEIEKLKSESKRDEEKEKLLDELQTSRNEAKKKKS